MLAKGSSSARLREEKLERRVKKELPALSRKLRTAVAEWEGAHGGDPFLIDGVRWLDTLEEEEREEASKAAEDRAKRETARKDKAGIPSAEAAPAPIAPAPLGSTHAAGGAAGGRMSVYRPAILGATAKGGLGATQAIGGPKALARKTSATAGSMVAPPALPEEGGAAAAAAPSAVLAEKRKANAAKPAGPMAKVHEAVALDTAPAAAHVGL